MRRYTVLVLTTLMFIIAVVAGKSYRVGADEKIFAVPMQELTAYTSLPAETVTILSETYEKENHVRVNFVPLPPKDILQKVQDDAVSDPTVVKTVDLILTDSKILQQVASLNLLTPHVSETNDAVKKIFKDDYDRWVGVWYDPMIFCANRDYLKKTKNIPSTWTELATLEGARIGVTDFLAADAAANLLFQMVENFGEPKTYEILSGLNGKVVQYTKYLSNPVRQAGMGEVDISVAVESETLRYMQEGYPLKIIYPVDGTSYLLTGCGITTQDSAKNIAAANFADWLLSDEVQMLLQKNGFYFISTNPQTLAYKTFAGKNLVLFGGSQNFTEQQKRELLDRWVKQVRFK